MYSENLQCCQEDTAQDTNKNPVHVQTELIYKNGFNAWVRKDVFTVGTYFF